MLPVQNLHIRCGSVLWFLLVDLKRVANRAWGLGTALTRCEIARASIAHLAIRDVSARCRIEALLLTLVERELAAEGSAAEYVVVRAELP